MGHAVAADAYLQRMGFSVDENAEPILEQIKKKYPRVGDSMLGAIIIRSNGDVTDLTREVDSLPLVSLSSSEKITQAHLVDALADMTVDIEKTITQPDGSQKNDFMFFSVDVAWKPRQNSMGKHYIKNIPDKLDEINNLLSGAFGYDFNFETDYERLTDELQSLLYSVNNGRGPAETFFNAPIDKAHSQIQGLSKYGNTAVSEFLAEAHTMIEAIQGIQNTELTRPGKDAIKNVRALYEDMLNPAGQKFELGLDDQARERLIELITEIERVEEAIEFVMFS
jgi:hypothetical protein